MPGKVCGKGGADEQKFHSSELILCFDKFWKTIFMFSKRNKFQWFEKTSATVKCLTESLYGLNMAIYKAHGLSQVDIEVWLSR